MVKTYYFETHKKHSKHIDTFYISVKPNGSLKNNFKFNKMLSFIEFSYGLHKKNTKNDLLKSYLNAESGFDMFYFENSKSNFRKTFKNGYKQYNYTFSNGGEKSLQLVNYLLKNYKPEKFVKLWGNNFFNFEGIYNESFAVVESELEHSFSNQIKYNNSYFLDCI